MSETKKTCLEKIGIGYKSGHLTVAAPTEERKWGYVMWDCECECGNHIRLDTKTLQRRTKTDCGCITRIPARAHDLRGRRFGRLVCIEPDLTRPKGSGVRWVCQCDCGKKCYSSAAVLLRGRKTSCGCGKGPQPKVLIGRTFGKLTVTGYSGKNQEMQMWKCKCTCGNEMIVDVYHLLTGSVTDCGCMGQAQNREAAGAAAESVTATDTGSPRNLEKTDPKSEVRGVWWNKISRKWTARLSYMHEDYYLGSFDKYEDAVEARKKAESKIIRSFPSPTPHGVYVIYWDRSPDDGFELPGGWHYCDPDMQYAIVKCEKDGLITWMKAHPEIRFGVSEAGNGIRTLYQHAREALKQCSDNKDARWVFYGDGLPDREELERLVEKRISLIRKRLDDMLTRYGELCTQETAAHILSITPGTLNQMLDDGRLCRVAERVDVRSICEYIERNSSRRGAGSMYEVGE